jgi:O-antigen/teichoic acid export membrane protein
VPDSLKRFGRTLSASPFVRNLARLAGATTLGGLLAFAASPIITRLYSPSEFAALGVFATTLSLLLAVASLRYDLAIPYPNEEHEAASVLALALLTIVGTTLLCALLIFIGLPSHVPGLNSTLSGGSIWWLPIGMWASASYAALSIWMIRRRDFATIGTTKITQGALQAGSQIVLGIARLGTSGLIIGQIVGSSGGLVRLWRQMRHHDSQILHRISRHQIVATARAYKRFPLYSAPAVLLDSATGAMPLLFIAAQFGPTSAGLYTLVQRVLTMPFALLTVNLGQLVFGDLAELRRSDPSALMLVFRRRVLQVALAGLVLILPLLFIVPLLLPRIFGERWSAAGLYFLILSPMTYAGFVAAPFGFVIDVLRRQDLHLLRDSVRAAIMGFALALAAELHTSLRVSLGLIALAGVLNGIFYLLISWRAIALHAAAVGGSAASALDTSAFIEPS